MSTFLPDATLAHLRAVADEPDLTGTRYRLLRRLGRGGMASVWAAQDQVLDREVAIKVLAAADPRGDLAARMLREARILARLEHPGIVPVHDAGRLPDGRTYYAMRRVRGRRLDEFAAGVHRTERLRIFQRICEAIAFAHAHGVLHRDLTPGNVMVGEFGEVLVMDWGVARVLQEAEPPAAPHDDTDPAATRHGTRLGTPGWMAPEQARGEPDRIDRHTDVWGLGALLHYLLHDAPPDADPPRAARVPRPLRAILARALQEEPAARYARVTDIAEDVDRFLTGSAVSAYREPILERALRTASKYRVPIALVLGYILMRILLLVFAGT